MTGLTPMNWAWIIVSLATFALGSHRFMYAELYRDQARDRIGNDRRVGRDGLMLRERLYAVFLIAAGGVFFLKQFDPSPGDTSWPGTARFVGILLLASGAWDLITRDLVRGWRSRADAGTLAIEWPRVLRRRAAGAFALILGVSYLVLASTI